MTTAVAVAVVLMVGLALAYVLRPLARPEEFAADDRSLTPAEQLARARGAIARALRDLDLDFGTGKLAEADYRQQRDQLERRALELRRAEDVDEAALSAAIEQEVLALRAGRSKQAPFILVGALLAAPGSPRVGEGSGEESERRPQPLPHCPWCHQPVREEETTCPRCGRSVREAMV